MTSSPDPRPSDPYDHVTGEIEGMPDQDFWLDRLAETGVISEGEARDRRSGR